jgi:hypothetical protein
MLGNVVIIGLGGVGTALVGPLALGLEKGERLELWDGDVYETKNLTRQLVEPKYVGWNKADAIRDRFGWVEGVESRAGWFVDDGVARWAPGTVVFVAVDNNRARMGALARVDRSPGVIGIVCANETTDAMAVAYLPEWKGTRLDPRVRYPNWTREDGLDPVAPSCAEQIDDGVRQLGIFNGVAAMMGLRLAWTWVKESGGVDSEFRDYLEMETRTTGTLTTGSRVRDLV